MSLSISKSMIIAIAVITFVAALASLAHPVPTAALPDYAAKTGQACGVCHVSPAGGGALTARGTAFAAIPTHFADPAAAFTQSGAAAQPAATPTAPPAAPAATPTAPAAPAATATPAPAKPAGTATPAPAPGALPRTGGDTSLPLVMLGGAIILTLGWAVRRGFNR